MSTRPPAGPRIFTVEQANRLLSDVRRLLAALRAERDGLRGLEQDVAVIELEGLQRSGAVSQEAHQRASAKVTDLEQGMERFHEVLAELDTLGCQLKDLDEGLIDFFTMHQGQLVYLCWKDGEDRIRYWHPLDDGFAGRRSITELANN